MFTVVPNQFAFLFHSINTFTCHLYMSVRLDLLQAKQFNSIKLYSYCVPPKMTHISNIEIVDKNQQFYVHIGSKCFTKSKSFTEIFLGINLWMTQHCVFMCFENMRIRVLDFEMCRLISNVSDFFMFKLMRHKQKGWFHWNPLLLFMKIRSFPNPFHP